MKEIICPNCLKKLQHNFMVFTQHMAKHNLAYSQVKEMWLNRIAVGIVKEAA